MDKQKLIEELTELTKDLKTEDDTKLVTDIGFDTDCFSGTGGDEHIEVLYIETTQYNYNEYGDVMHIHFPLSLPKGWSFYGPGKNYVTNAGLGISITVDILRVLNEYTEVPFVLYFENRMVYIISDNKNRVDDFYKITIEENGKIKYKYIALGTYEGVKIFASNFSKYKVTINK